MRYVSLRSSFILQRLFIASVCFCANTSQPAFGTDSGQPYAYADVNNPHAGDVDPRDPSKKMPLAAPYYQVDATHFAVSSDAKDIQKAKDAEQDINKFLGLTNQYIAENLCAVSRKIQKNMVKVKNADGDIEVITQCELNYRNARAVAQQYEAATKVAKDTADEIMAKQLQQERCNESAYHIQLEEQARLDGPDSERKMLHNSKEEQQIQAEVDALGDPEHKERSTASQAACGALGVETADLSRAMHDNLHAAAEQAEEKITQIMASVNQ